MADIKRTTEGLKCCLARYVDGLCDDCPYMGEIDRSYMIPMKCKEIIMRDALELLKEQQAEIERLKQEKADAIERIKRMAEEIPYTPAKTETDGIYLSGKYWGMKDALDILKDKDGEQ